MTDSILKHLAEIAHLDAQIDDLQEERDTHTYPLEKAAHAYHTAHPQGRAYYQRGALGCSRCRFVYGGSLTPQETVSFFTDCSWCGKDGGAGLEVLVSELIKYMEEN